MDHDDLTCRQLLSMLADYLAGDLGASERARADRHLDGCAECRSYRAGYEATIDLAREAEAARSHSAAPVSLPEDLARTILASRRRSH